MSDTVDTPAQEPSPPSDPAPVKEEVKQTEERVDALQAQLDSGDLTPAQEAKVEAKISALDQKIDALVSKIDAMGKAPVAPSPRKETPPVKAEGVSDDVPETSAPKTKKPKSRYPRSYWGDRADSD